MRVEAGLRAFAAFARNRSFSSAGEELGISQPTLSRHVAERSRTGNQTVERRVTASSRMLVISSRITSFGRQRLPMGKVVFRSSRFWQRPIRSGSPLIGTHKPVTDRRLVHEAGILPLQLVAIPADDLVVVLMEWPLHLSRAGKQQLPGRNDILKIVLSTKPTELVSVGVGVGS